MAYTEIFKAASPLRGGSPVTAIAGGTFGHTGSGVVTGVSTTLASCMIVMMYPYRAGGDAPLASGGPGVSLISGGYFDFHTDAACSGAWLAFGY